MLSYRDLLTAFRKLGLDQSPVIAHASLSAFGEVQGGADTLVGAMLAAFPSVIMPTFTYKTMVTPRVGPPDNGITYAAGENANHAAEFYHPDMPADAMMGRVAETLRRHPKARRSVHPIYSFAGVNADRALVAQTIVEPFGPIRVQVNAGGWVLLMGVDHTVNTSIHFAEQLADRKQFIRWALTPQGIIECPRWPGCSYGFNQVIPRIAVATIQMEIGQALVQAIPGRELVETVVAMIGEDPYALLCRDPECERCKATRQALASN